jgi:hypothetical protein
MRLKMCLGVKHFHEWGRIKEMEPNDSKCIPTLGNALVRELRMFKALIGKAKKHQIGA